MSVGPNSVVVRAVHEGREYPIEISRQGEAFLVSLDGADIPVRRIFSDSSHDVLQVGNTCFDVITVESDGVYEVDVVNHSFSVQVVDPRRSGRKKAAMGGGDSSVSAKMPGRVVKVHVRPGDRVDAGQGLLIIESMKMQNEIRSPRDGVVESVYVEENETVDSGREMVRFEAVG